MADSCDTFVVLPSGTAKGCVIFGKNSDRPADEVQEVVYVPAADHGSGQNVQCTYIEIPQAAHTHAVMLSKPAWLWGAEMGANEHSVAIGNEAVWTKEAGPQDAEEALLGMDLVRLGLERGSTAKEALDVITGMLEKFGQGGCCIEMADVDYTYHNSFIIADPTEAWVLETAGRHWAAEKITSGYRNISNMLSIRTKIDAISEGTKEYAKQQGYWNGKGDFDFAQAFSDGDMDDFPFELMPKEMAQHRYQCGKELLKKYSEGGKFTAVSMMDVLRDKPSGICWLSSGGTASTGSQVSVLVPPSSKSCHWFTATPNPGCSVFKPFVFCKEPAVGILTVSPSYGAQDPVKVKPRFQTEVDRMHPLYKAHQRLKPLPGGKFPQDILKSILALEAQSIQDVDQLLDNFDASKAAQLQELYKTASEKELKFYQGKSNY